MMWTPAMVEDRLRQALVTLRRIPGGRIFPAGLRSGWPDFVRTYLEGYGWDRAVKPRVQATSEDIRQMDETLAWVATHLNAEAALRAGLVEDSVKIVMWRATGRRWDQIAVWRGELWGMRPQHKGGRSPIPGGNSYPSLRKIHDGAIRHLCERLNGRRDPGALAREREHQEQLEAVVEVTFPVGEVGTYGPVRARARHVVRAKRRGPPS